MENKKKKKHEHKDCLLYTSWITTSTAKKKYEIFSIYVETKDFSYMDVNFASDKDYLEHITKLKEKSMYDTGVEVNSDDEVLILQTCSTHKDYSNYQRKYLLIILRRDVYKRQV